MTFQLDPRLDSDSFTLGQFELCQLLLMNDSQYPWFTLVPMKPDVCEIYQLSPKDQTQLWLESRILSQVVMGHFDGDKLNVAAIGNIVSQLHLHHVVRFSNDASWPKPIWGQLPMVAYSDTIKNEIINKVGNRLMEYGFKFSEKIDQQKN